MPASFHLLQRIADQLGPRFADADSRAVVDAAASLMDDEAAGLAISPLPETVTLELTPRRLPTGPIVPQHYVPLNRPDMDADLARRIVRQLGGERAVCLTLGGLGDPLLHPQWAEIVEAAAEAGVFGIAVETDLLVEPEAVRPLLDLPIDVVSVRLNADTAGVYRQVMGLGEEDFRRATGNLEWLLNERNRRCADPMRLVKNPPGVPWLVPRLAKTADTLADLETFFDRWTHYLGHAVIDGPQAGCGLMPELSPVRMAPPRRFACRQIMRRLTIHSDGRAALCDQDWQARAALGDAATETVADLWRKLGEVRQAHREGQWSRYPLCAACHEWHRP